MDSEHRRKEMEARLDEISAEIRRLKAEADKAGAEGRQKMYEEIRRLESQEEDARQRMKKLREAGTAAFDDMVKGAEKAWASLADAVDQARKRFK